MESQADAGTLWQNEGPRFLTGIHRPVYQFLNAEIITVPVIGDKPELNLKSVVYATDFSICSQHAGLYSKLLARYFSATLFVAHAFTLSQSAMEVEVDHRLVSQQRKDLQFLLTRKASLLGNNSHEVIPALIEGDPTTAIPALAEDHAPSLIVLGTHGGTRISRGVIGSVAEHILRSTRWPSLTVGPQVPSPPAAAFPFERILYATDFTTAAAHAAAFAVSFAQTFGAEIDVLNVIQAEAVEHPDRFSDLSERFYKSLDKVVPRQASEFCDPRTFVEIGKAHEKILDHIRDRSIDLLVLGIRKTSHLGLEMRTSGAFQLIVDAQCPVLTVTG